MSDNSNGGMYAVTDPTGSTVDPQEPQQGAPLPTTGQPQPLDPSVQTQAPDTSNAGQVSQQAYNPAPAGSMPAQPAPQTQTQKFLERARAISDAMVPQSYSTKIDPDTGDVTRTPLHPRSIGIALALEALSGAAAGLGAGRGPGGLGKAAAAGLQQGQQQAKDVQQANQQREQQARQDFTNQLQFRSFAMQNGRLNDENAQAAVQRDASVLSDYQKNYADKIIGDDLSADQAKAAVAKNPGSMLLFSGTHTRKDANGNVVYTSPSGRIVPEGTPGAYPASDFSYAVVANAPVSWIKDGKLDPKIKRGIDLNLISANGFDPNNVPQNQTMDMRKYVSMTNAINAVDGTQAEVNQTLAQLGQKPIDISADVKNNPGIIKPMQTFTSVISHGGTYQQALDSIKDTPQYQGVISGWFGGKAGIDKLHLMTAHTDAQNAMSVEGVDPKNVDQILGNPSLYRPEIVKDAQTIRDNQVKQDTATAGATAGAAARAKLPYEEDLEDHKAAIAAKNKSPEEIQQTAEGVANGSLTLDTITDRPTRSKVEAYLTQHHPNLDQNSVTLTPDARKKQQLAQADLLNLGVVRDVLTRRPQLVGALAGRITNGEWAVGTNDPDLTKLKLAYDNYALPAVGIHGSRSVVNKEEAIKALSNDNKNGAQAVLAGVKDAENSANVFAHPSTPRGKNGSLYIVLPTPSTPNQVIDGPTVQKYITKYGSPAAARAAAQKDGWALPGTQGSK